MIFLPVFEIPTCPLSFTTTSVSQLSVAILPNCMHVFSTCHSCLDIILAELCENELNDVANVSIK